MKVYFSRGIITVLLFLSISEFHLVYPFEETKSVDVRALSLGQIKALSKGLTNPAYVPFSERKEIGVSVYTRFEMKELSTRSIYSLIPNRLLDMSLHLSIFGYDDYQLIEGQAGFAKKLTQNFSIGASVSYISKNSILEESIQSYLHADLSFLWRINDSFDWAFATENLIHTKNTQPSYCFTGVKYQLIPTTSVLLEAGYDLKNQLSLSAGFEYEIVDQLMVRGGFRNNPRMPSLGFAYNYRNWKVETAFLFHSALGLCSGISASYLF